jgi:hypothetical protein
MGIRHLNLSFDLLGPRYTKRRPPFYRSKSICGDSSSDPNRSAKDCFNGHDNFQKHSMLPENSSRTGLPSAATFRAH